jgi:hypothetical protein
MATATSAIFRTLRRASGAHPLPWCNRLHPGERVLHLISNSSRGRVRVVSKRSRPPLLDLREATRSGLSFPTAEELPYRKPDGSARLGPAAYPTRSPTGSRDRE